MKRARVEKPLRRPIYLGNQARAARLDRLRQERGLTSDSELVRRLIDDAPLRGASRVSPIGEVRLSRRGVDLTAALGAMQRALIEQALSLAKGSVSGAARLLGVSRRSLQRRIERLGVRGSDAPCARF